jgi:hypothetical protein
VVDASSEIMALHQNHDHSYHPQGKQGVWNDAEAGKNYQLAGGWRHLRTIADATEVLGSGGLKPNAKRHWKRWSVTRMRVYTRRVAMCCSRLGIT